MASFLMAPEPTSEPAVRTDPSKLALLRDAVAAKLADVPQGTDPALIDVFALTVSLNQDIDGGTLALARGDFDGNDVQSLVTDLLLP